MHKGVHLDPTFRFFVCLYVCLFVCFLFCFCFVLFCFVLVFCFVLFCFVLFCFILFCFVLFCFLRLLLQHVKHSPSPFSCYCLNISYASFGEKQINWLLLFQVIRINLPILGCDKIVLAAILKRNIFSILFQ